MVLGHAGMHPVGKLTFRASGCRAWLPLRGLLRRQLCSWMSWMH